MRHLLVGFLAVALVLTATLVWLSWQLVRQDEALAEQRIDERRESAADLATVALQKSLLQAEEQLSVLSGAPAGELSGRATEVARRLGADSALVICRAEGVEVFPDGRLPFQATRPSSAPPARDVFARADSLEFFRQNFGEAADVLRRLSRAEDPATRAGALMRLARIHRKRGQLREALAAYESLAALDPVPVEGLPAGLVARHASLTLLESLGERERLAREATALRRDVRAGRWPLLRAEYGFYLSEAQRRLGPAEPDAAIETDAPVVRASAVESLWNVWRSVRLGEDASQGRRVVWLAGTPVLLLWRAAPEMMAGLALGPGDVTAQGLSALGPTLAQQGVGLVLTDGEGRAVIGRLTGGAGRQSLRPASTTSLPWNLHALTLDAGARHAYFDARRRVLFGALLSIALLVLAGTYFLWRVVAREMAVARLQADFVSAVSHEFRTPLTALRQFSELLVSDRVASEHDRRQYDEAMAHESGRLGRLVERLLDFGRMESGTLRYRLEPLDPAVLLGEVVAEFERSGDARGHRIELNAVGPAQLVQADRETLGCVIWNLLDNAVKYSPECSTVWG